MLSALENKSDRCALVSSCQKAMATDMTATENQDDFVKNRSSDLCLVTGCAASGSD